MPINPVTKERIHSRLYMKFRRETKPVPFPVICNSVSDITGNRKALREFLDETYTFVDFTEKVRGWWIKGISTGGTNE